MNRLSSKLAVSATLGLTAVGALAGLAWACTQQASVTSFSPQAGPAGTHVSISGADFRPTGPKAAPVEIRWGSLDGPLLATAQGPEFSVEVAVPENVPAGVNYLVAVQRDAEGEILFKGADTFEVVGATASSSTHLAGDLWQGLAARGSSSLTTEPGAIQESGSNNMLPVGLGLTAIGLMATLTSLVVVRRRSHSAN